MHFFLNAKNAFLTCPVHFVDAKSNSCMKTVGLQGQFYISKKKKKMGRCRVLFDDNSEDYIGIKETEGVEIVLLG